MSTCISRVALSLLSTMKLRYQRIHVNNRRRSGDPGGRPVVTHDLVNGRGPAPLGGMSASEGLRRNLRCAVDKTHRLLSNMTIRCNRCTRKRFRWYKTHQQTAFVPPKTFSRYKIPRAH